MSGECEKCHEHCLDCKCELIEMNEMRIKNLQHQKFFLDKWFPGTCSVGESDEVDTSINKSIIERLEDIGICREKMSRICDHEIFYDISKHNRFWRHKDPVASAKLEIVRCQLSYIHQNLLEVWSVLSDRGEE